MGLDLVLQEDAKVRTQAASTMNSAALGCVSGPASRIEQGTEMQPLDTDPLQTTDRKIRPNL